MFLLGEVTSANTSNWDITQWPIKFICIVHRSLNIYSLSQQITKRVYEQFILRPYDTVAVEGKGKKWQNITIQDPE